MDAKPQDTARGAASSRGVSSHLINVPTLMGSTLATVDVIELCIQL